MSDATTDEPTLVRELLSGDQRALARVISKIEDRAPGYRDLVAACHRHAGDATVLGITGSPGSGKSTLVDKLAATYRDQGETVGIIAVDPSSPFTGGAVLGDRIRMGSNVGDMDVFVRSMSARGTLGGLSTATADAVTALDAFGKDRIIIETVGAGQNEVDIVRTADTVAVLVPPGSGDDVQMLKAGILEIGDVFVVNKADLSGADRMVSELREMLQERRGETAARGHHGHEAPPDGDEDSDGGSDASAWRPEVVETVASDGDGIPELVETFAAHHEYLVDSGALEAQRRERYAEMVQDLVRADLRDLAARRIQRMGGLESAVDRIVDRETDPYAVAEDIIGPIADCVEGAEDKG
ncbi:MAG: methylmalonyl Co-A mutase-associated GTPase MeaB [Halobacteriaceae archaeon]